MAETYGFSDYVDDGESLRLEVELQLCYKHYSDSDDVACESEEDTDAYFQDNTVELYWFATQTKVDYSREKDYVDHSIAWIARDDIKPYYLQSRETKLRINHVTMSDQIWDIFEESTDEITYLQPMPSTHNFYEVYYPGYYHVFEIDIDIQEQSRQRYTFWHLLSDAGGLHDGLAMIVWAFLYPVQSSRFELDLTKKARKGKKQTQS